MILLFDLNGARAEKALAQSTNVLIWKNSAWRDSSDRNTNFDPINSWFLLHNTDRDIFSNWIAKQNVELRKLPVIRFTGGDPTGRPNDKVWVRYRSIDVNTPFQLDELNALDSWVQNGCREGNRPWLLFQDKPYYLRGLLILLQLAQLVGPAASLSSPNRKFMVMTPQWWHDHLECEENWAECVRQELARRPRDTDTLSRLDEFIGWVQKKELPTGVQYDLFGAATADPDPDSKQTQLDKLISILNGLV